MSANLGAKLLNLSGNRQNLRNYFNGVQKFLNFSRLNINFSLFLSSCRENNVSLQGFKGLFGPS